MALRRAARPGAVALSQAARWGLLLAGACSSGPRVPELPLGEPTVPLEQWVEVQTAPPPVEAEEIGAPPSPGHVWVDGQWAYQPVTSRWVWEQGRWCLPPPGALYYARPRLQRERRTVTQQSGAPMRTVRWNEMLKRYEKVDRQDDGYRWLKGAFYVRGADGAVGPFAGEVGCAEAKGEAR